MSATIDRAAFLKQTGGVLLVGFSLGAPAAAQNAAAPQATVNPTLIGAGSNAVDAWLAVDHAGLVTVYSGKVELGTGTETALLQLVADELGVPFASVRMIAGITGVTPDQGVTSGSQTIMTGSIPMRRAAATARRHLLDLAAQRFQVASADLVTRDGYVMPRDGDRSRAVGYGELIGGRKFDLTIDPATPLMSPSAFRLVGQPLKRVDFPGKAYGTFKYVQNVRIPGMWHARVIRPVPVGATFVSLDRASIAAIPNVRVVQKGNFVAVAAPKEWDAIRAARALKVTWSGGGLPVQSELYDIIRKTPAVVKVAAQAGDADAALAGAGKKLAASYSWPFQTHGSIGPSCGVAEVRPDGSIAVWNGTQGVYQMRDAIAQLVGVAKDAVTLNYVEASGCYGHNGADDAGTDAVLVAQAIGKPVRVQWSRADEHGWDPKGPAMVMDLAGAVGPDGTVTAWKFDGYTPTHSTRPTGMAGNLLDGQLTGAPPAKNGNIGGDRNAAHIYAFPNQRVSVHWQPTAVLGAAALRGLGAPQNCFANESFLDELCHAAGADPVAFRLAHLTDPRARDVMTAVAKLAKWEPGRAKRPAGNGVVRGRGVAFARYETTDAYVAMIADVDVTPASGALRVRDVFVAHDCGLIVNPDGLRNQIEGAVIQGTSRALKEQVTFDRSSVTSVDWRTYPIVRFSEVPDVHITLIDRPAERPLGAGEPATIIVAPAIGNAVFAATGARLREVPFSAARVKIALAST
jgi:CO/xanthine dehydrogenase Mo-binding subunit